MIRVSCGGTALSIQGHAGAAPYGQDLVCAAVSALVYALAQRLTELDQLGAFEESPVVKLQSGQAEIIAAPKRKYAATVAEDFRLVQSGLKLLAKHYPGQVVM